MRCQKCTFTNEPEAMVCKSCGFMLRATRTPSAPSAFAPNNAKSLKQGLAITSLVLGTVSLPLSCVGFIFAIPGIIIGIIALVKISKQPAIYGGKGLAIGGIATGSFSLLVVIPIIAAIAIPNLLQARKAANKAAAIGRLRQIASAEVTAFSSQNKYVSINDLVVMGLLDGGQNDPIRSGYKLTFRLLDDKSFEAVATPISPSNGEQSFYLSQDGAIHVSDKEGRAATADDPILGAPQARR